MFDLGSDKRKDGDKAEPIPKIFQKHRNWVTTF